MLEIGLASFVSFFVIVDPLGTSAVFSALTSGAPAQERRMIAVKAFVIATLLLVLFGIGGKFLLLKVGISLDAFRVAGGLLLFVTAFRMIMGFHDKKKLESSENCYSDNSSVAIFPLAIPLLAGPGCMTSVILNMSSTPIFYEKVVVMFAMVLVQILALFAMLTAGKITQILGDSAASLLARLMGILLASLSVQFVADGTKSLFGI